MKETAPWTIKGVPVKTRQLALKCANAQDQVMAEWITDAVQKLAAEQSGMIIPPSLQPEAAAPAEMLNLDLVGMAAAIQATLAAHAALGVAPPAALGKEAAMTVRKYMRAARGTSSKVSRSPRADAQRTIEHTNGVLAHPS